MEREDDSQLRELMTEYVTLGQGEIDIITDNDLYPKGQIGLMVATAGIYHKLGRFSSYQTDLSEAVEYADNMGFEDVAEGIIENRLEIFREDFKRGLEDLFSLLEIVDEPLSPDPFSLGIDDRTFEELRRSEKLEAEKILLAELGVETEVENRVKSKDYQVLTRAELETRGGIIIPPHSQVSISIYETNRHEEGIFLQELVFADGEKRFLLGNDQEI